MRALIVMVVVLASAVGCHEHKPPAPPVANEATAPAPAPAPAPAAAADHCAASHGCTPCIQALCQWDLKQQTCSSDCKGDDCLETGSLRPLAEKDAAEICKGARAGS